MSGPKHLWSGDWERESAALTDDLAERRPRHEDGQATAPPAARVWAAPRQTTKSAPEREAPAPRARSRRRQAAATRPRPRWLPILPVVVAAALVLAGAGYGLSAVLGSSHNTTQTAQTQASGGSPSPPPARVAPIPPSTPTTPQSGGTQTTPASVSGPVSWLGMELLTVPPGAVVVETVTPQSEAALARLEPGDVIVAVNGRQISAANDIRAAIGGLRRGVLVPLQVSRGSTLFTTQAALAAPPSP